MTSTRRAIIIGGGIAGPAVAMALQRAGITSTIYEAYAEPSDHRGWFLNVASNGLAVLRTLGVRLDDSDLDGHRMPRMLMSSGSGRHLGEVANGIRLSDGIESLAVKRGELQRRLRSEVEERGISIERGKRLTDYRVKNELVTAQFADGTCTDGHLLIGADGIHSRTRSILDEKAPSPSYTGLLSIGGYTRDLSVPSTPGVQHFVFGRRAFFGYLVRDSGEVWWFANLASPKPPSRDAATVLDADDLRRWKLRLLELFDDDLPLIGEIVEAADELGVHPIYDLPSLAVWQRDPVALVGDAAHATSPNAGQGVSMALEDALVLAKALRGAQTTRQALGAYEDERRPRAERVVAYSRQIGQHKAAGPIGRVVRDLMLPVVLRFFASPKALAWLYDHHIDWDAPLAVPREATGAVR